MQKILASITQKFRLTSICTVCKQYHQQKNALCESCMHSFIIIPYRCIHCANPLPDDTWQICGKCIQQKPYFDEAMVYYLYEEPLCSLIHQFKYEQKLYLGELFAELINHSVISEKPECLIPVPMHPYKLRERGFNQAAILAKQLAKKWQIPCNFKDCIKIVNTPPQAGLNAKERIINLKNAFQVNPLPYQHIGIVDDLLTTGNTANALARMIKLQGVQRVTLYCIART